MPFFFEPQQFGESTASQYLTVQPNYFPPSPSSFSSLSLPSPASLSSLSSSPNLSDTLSSSPNLSDIALSSSPNLSDSDEFSTQMGQVETVKRLLRMVPPPMTAEEFIAKNPFESSDGHIKRPSNNFILFRKIAHDQKNQTDELTDYNEREFSKIIGKIWEGLSKEEKEEYKKLGKKVAEVHKMMFPNYKYQPKRDKAAWKHFNPLEPNHQKSRNKKRNIKQKHQDTTPEITNNVPLPTLPKVNLGIQEPQIVSSISTSFLQTNSLSEISTDLNNSIYYESFNPANNPIFEDIGFNNVVNEYSFLV